MEHLRFTGCWTLKSMLGNVPWNTTQTSCCSLEPSRSSETLTGPFLGGHPGTLQVGGLKEDGGGVQSVGGESVEAVLRNTGGDGDLMLSFAGGCRAERNRESRVIDLVARQIETQIPNVTFTVIKRWLGRRFKLHQPILRNVFIFTVHSNILYI